MTSFQIEQTLRAANDLHRAARLTDAARLFQQVLAADPRHAHALNAMGIIAMQSGRLDESIGWYQKAIDADPSNPGFYMNMGSSLMQMNRLAEAADIYQRIIARQPDFADAYSNLAIALSEAKRHDEAAAVCRKALELNPNLVSAWMNLGTILRTQGKFHEAADAYRRGLKLAPGRPDLLTNLGSCLMRIDQFDEAMKLHKQAMDALPGYAAAIDNMGVTFHKMGRYEEALTWMDQALALAPDASGIHLDRGFALLTLGRWAEGLAEYEWRLRDTRYFYLHRFARPLWDGSDPTGRTILLVAEQGLGDMIQFIRYADLLARRGARVIVECQPELRGLIAGAAGVSQVSAQGEALPEHDLYLPIASVLERFAVRPDNVLASIPYLHADAARVEAWRQRLAEYGPGLKVGLVWAGSALNTNDHQRSIPLPALAPLATQSPNVRFFSLQKGPAAAHATTPPAGMKIVDLSSHLEAFDDTAAALMNLDLLISVDTSVAHLAGALGRPVWTLIQFSPDWRWLLNRTDTPWYPTMRLFRQPKPGDWGAVIDEVARGLKEMAGR